jgi:hypothetical protein
MLIVFVQIYFTFWGEKKVIAVFGVHAYAIFSLLGKFQLLHTQLLQLTEVDEALK